jgi:hypothetical protein
MPRKRYALVGTGSRASMFLDALATTYRDVGELVALCDVSQTRMDWHLSRLQSPPISLLSLGLCWLKRILIWSLSPRRMQRTISTS